MLELAYLLTTIGDLAMVVVVVKEVIVVAKNTGIDIFAHSHCQLFIWFLNHLCADVKVDGVHDDDGGGCEKCFAYLLLETAARWTSNQHQVYNVIVDFVGDGNVEDWRL